MRISRSDSVSGLARCRIAAPPLGFKARAMADVSDCASPCSHCCHVDPGSSVALSYDGSRLVVSGRSKTGSTPDAVVYVYTRNGSQWDLEDILHTR